jgi:hypothetical protein
MVTRSRFWSIALVLPAAALIPGPLSAQATPAAEVDALSECLVAKSTGADRVLLAKWIAAAMLSAPQLADIGKVDASKRDSLDRDTAALFTRIVTKDCLEQARPAFKQGSTAMSGAFEALGRVAMQELTGNPQSSAAFATFTKYLREEDFAGVRAAK